MSGFVNPYTFVPLPDVDPAAFRRAPVGHHRLGTARDGAPRLLGEIQVDVVARSPLLLRDSEGRFPRRRFVDGDQTAESSEPEPFLPGSGVAGVVRSLHESLAGGCLRVFDAEFVPSYRDPVRARDLTRWTLALVEGVHDGRPVRLRLCTQVVRVRADVLAAVLGGPRAVVTGARVNVLRSRETGAGLPGVVTAVHDVEPGDGWVVLVTDSRARDSRVPYYCTVGRLSTDDDDVLSCTGDEERKQRWDKAWREFQSQIRDTDDMRRARGRKNTSLHPTNGPVTAEVYFPPTGRQAKLVGVRHEARLTMFSGQVLWVKRGTGGSVDEFALATVWRHLGGGAARDRVPAALLPCSDPDSLCPTCRIFGSADTGGAAGGHAEQRGYRGHVRFSDGRPLPPVPAVQTRPLAPLGRPRPGAGQFYLRNDPHQRPEEGGDRLSEWGSAADTRRLRPLRGRKHYWLTGTPDERPLFRTEGAFDGEMATPSAEFVPAGTRFTFTVRFENLDVAELGGLLAALDPAIVLSRHLDDDAEIGVAVGGGKPFGFGTCTTTIAGLTVHTAASWYGGAEPPAVDTQTAIDVFVAAVDRGVRATWPALAAALHLDHVPPGVVWYPPATEIPPGPLVPADLRAGIQQFWKQSRGYALASREVPLLPLPEVTAADQTLPVSGAQPQPRQGNRQRQGRQGGGRGGGPERRRRR